MFPGLPRLTVPKHGDGARDDRKKIVQLPPSNRSSPPSMTWVRVSNKRYGGR